MAHREVHEIGRPPLPEDRLLAQPRNHALERDEEQREDEQIAAQRADLGGRAAEQRAGGGQGHAGEAENPSAAQDDAQRAEAEAEDEHDVDQEPDDVHRIERSRRRGGQKAREEQTEHAAVAECPTRDRQDSADPAGAEAVAGAATEPDVPGPAFRTARGLAHAKVKARAGFSTRRRRSPASSTPLARRRGTTFTSRWWEPYPPTF